MSSLPQWWLVVLLILGTAGTGRGSGGLGLGAAEDPAAGTRYGDEPGLLGPAPQVLAALDALDHPDWQRREEATHWLVEHSAAWSHALPADWRPGTAEARWRWAVVLERVDRLATLNATLRRRPDPVVRARLAELRDETGSAFLDALVHCLEDPESRVRARAVELLGTTVAGRHRLRRTDIGQDLSGHVREQVYEVARRHDRDWAHDLLRDALRSDVGHRLIGAAAQGAQRLGDPRLLPDLRRHFTIHGEPHPDVVLALAAFARPEDAPALDWLLRSPEYRHASVALDGLAGEQVIRHADAIAGLLRSEHWDLRIRALRRLEDGMRSEVPYLLLPLLDSPDIEIYQFGVDHLVRLGGEDFLGDVELSLRRWPLGARPYVIAAEGSHAVPRPVPFLAAPADPVPAVAPDVPADIAPATAPLSQDGSRDR